MNKTRGRTLNKNIVNREDDRYFYPDNLILDNHLSFVTMP